MKRFLIFLTIMFVAGPSLVAQEQTILARITVYWPSGRDGHIASSNGAKLQRGHCAVDPKKIAFGSKVVFPDGACLAIDSGPAVIKRTAARRFGKTTSERNALVIDRYFETRRDALAWAAAHPHFITVRVVEPQRETGRLTDVVESTSNAVAQHQLRSAAMKNMCAVDPDELPSDAVRAPLSWFGGSIPRS
jgi:3D (Asp-Asp-Asp) domain-containing protein